MGFPESSVETVLFAIDPHYSAISFPQGIFSAIAMQSMH
jgi:hypothetical protein